MIWCLEKTLTKLIIRANIKREEQYKVKTNQYIRVSEFDEKSRVGIDIDHAIFRFSLMIWNWGLYLKYYEKHIYEIGIVKEHLKLQKE